MTLKELEILRIDAQKEARSLEEHLLNRMNLRKEVDKVPRCLRCGVCMPVGTVYFPHGFSIYSEFCQHCNNNL